MSAEAYSAAMRRALLLVVLVGAGCNSEPAAKPKVDCSAAPAVVGTAWRHARSRAVAGLGDFQHRGIDLIATTTAITQALEGKLAYGKVDKDLEDEDVEVFVCRDATWKRLGITRTDDDGRFKLELGGADRLGPGLHDLYLSVTGDRTGARFVGLIAAEQTPLIVSDVDGTLTRSEKSFYGTVVFDDPADVQPTAATVLLAAAAKGIQPVYVTARGSQFTEDTRRWLLAQGFPRGPIRFTPGAFVLPGERTVEYKTSTIALLAASFKLVAGIGNRASDITAYTNVGLPAERIFIKLPEFTDELLGPLGAKRATGFAHYRELLPAIPTL